MRLSGNGQLDRKSSVNFTFDGNRYSGFTGDTLASALLAHGQHLMGRSFKYHRPRGVMTAGSEEPNALVTLGRGAGQDPNQRATMVELQRGLEARSQNVWPSLGFDLLSINDLAAPFLGAGFYYKTFMWPRKFWEWVYEPAIRRAAGLGALSGKHNEDSYERAFAHCDLLIIGAGPAGLMAAYTAVQSGADVILADEDTRAGGRVLSDPITIDGQDGAAWAETMIKRLQSFDNIRIMTRTTVTGAYDQGTYGAYERLPQLREKKGAPVACFWRIHARKTILCSGALERPIAFQNNDRPAIMMAGAVRSYVNRWRVAPGQSVTVFGNTDSAHMTAKMLLDEGVHVAALIDARSDATTDLDVRFVAGGQVCNTGGRKQIESITIRTASGEEKIQTDALAISGGWNPSVHLTCHMNARPVWNDAIAAFVPADNAIPELACAGSVTGAFSTLDCLRQGNEAAVAALKDLRITADPAPLPDTENAAYSIHPVWAVAGKGRAWLDFQNDVTVKDVKQAAAENFRSVEHMKRYTTQGMAPDQGKNSNIQALAILADATGRTVSETGTTTYRPPFVPVPIGAMGAGAQGKGFAPERKTTSHRANVKLKAPMIEAGLWYRPSFFPREGEKTWRQSCDREVAMVRNTVGICDVSTLGKIDIQGRDAGVFLDFVYTNTFSNLKVGRTRYGLMLREDGHVMDDGTTARLGENHLVMTTTTAAAAQVMRHLDFVRQCLRPDWDVQIMSVTEQWAQFAVAGPRSRDLLNDLLDEPIDNENWPFMACGDVSISGVRGRLFRISFSGEHAYEISVPSRYGASLFDALLRKAEIMGGGPYGMEALNVLRIEKGFITHAEIHGRVTAFDIGMAGMVSGKKDCIGKASATRVGLIGPKRQQLVGLKPVGATKQLLPGAHLFDTDDSAERVYSKGYVTSACYSPTLETTLALGFLENGRARHGQHVKMVDHLRGVTTRVEVCNPVFFDSDGGRARG